MKPKTKSAVEAYVTRPFTRREGRKFLADIKRRLRSARFEEGGYVHARNIILDAFAGASVARIIERMLEAKVFSVPAKRRR